MTSGVMSLKARMRGEMRHILHASSDEVVDADDLRSILQKMIGEMAADEPRGAGQNDAHVICRSRRSGTQHPPRRRDPENCGRR